MLKLLKEFEVIMKSNKNEKYFNNFIISNFSKNFLLNYYVQNLNHNFLKTNSEGELTSSQMKNYLNNLLLISKNNFLSNVFERLNDYGDNWRSIPTHELSVYSKLRLELIFDFLTFKFDDVHKLSDDFEIFIKDANVFTQLFQVHNKNFISNFVLGLQYNTFGRLLLNSNLYNVKILMDYYYNNFNSVILSNNKGVAEEELHCQIKRIEGDMKTIVKVFDDYGGEVNPMPLEWYLELRINNISSG